MDIEYLLLLQNFRESIDIFFTSFMEAVSNIVLDPMFFWCIAMLYWLFDKRAGSRIMLTFAFGEIVNQLVKLTACVYRPWIRDSRIMPAGDSIRTAGGYSFPSGHTARAMAVYGSAADEYRKKYKWITFLLGFLVLLTGFSRNFLGVHTPQDVIVAIVEIAVIIYLTGHIRDVLDKKPSSDIIVFVVGIVFSALSLVYIVYKPYPMDYVDGELLVDPVRMMKGGYLSVAMLAGSLFGWFIERRFIKYEPDRKNPISIILGIAGYFPLYYLRKVLSGQITEFIGTNCAGMAVEFCSALFIMAVWPVVLKLTAGLYKKHSNKPEQA